MQYTWEVGSIKEAGMRRRKVNHGLLRIAIQDIKAVMRAACDSETKSDLARVGITLSNLMVK